MLKSDLVEMNEWRWRYVHGDFDDFNYCIYLATHATHAGILQSSKTEKQFNNLFCWISTHDRLWDLPLGFEASYRSGFLSNCDPLGLERS